MEIYQIYPPPLHFYRAKDEKAKDSKRLFKINLVARLEVACRHPSLSSRMSNQGNFLPRRCCWVDCPLFGRVYSRVASPPSSAFLTIRGNSLDPAFRLPHPFLDIYPGRTTGSVLESPGPAVPVLPWTSSPIPWNPQTFLPDTSSHLGPLPLSLSSNKFTHLYG